MKHHAIVGGGGCRIHVIEAGNPTARPILFIHGFSQCSLAWSQQLSSNLGRNHRLVAMDMRGHGSSDTPREGYGDSRLWADDVDAVVRALRLDRPVLSGWSYGAFVILDYIRHYGEERISGIHFVDAITKLGSEAAISVLTPELLALVPGFFSRDMDEGVRSLQSLLRLCFVNEPSEVDRYTMLGYNVAVPPFVREALFSRIIDNDDLLRTIRAPVLITHGANDAVVKVDVVEQHSALLAHSQIHIMPNAGHAPFRDDAAAFNERLAAFCEDVARRPQFDRAREALTSR